MNIKYLLLIPLLALSSCSSPNRLSPLSSVRPGVVTEGTLANEQLVADTTAAIHKLIGGAEPVVPFVIQRPVGQPGRKAWRELWVYDPKGRQQQFIITFNEDGKGSAYYTINAH